MFFMKKNFNVFANDATFEDDPETGRKVRKELEEIFGTKSAKTTSTVVETSTYSQNESS